MPDFNTLEYVEDLTGWSDADLAVILGVSRQLVQKYRTGAAPIYLSGLQRHALLQAVRLFRDQIIQGVAELELRS